MSKKAVLATFFIQLLLWQLASAQTRDTLLNMVRSDPYFYNVIKWNGDRVLAGTSEGIIELDGVTIRPIDPRKGYLTSNDKGELSIDDAGIRYYTERKFLHLLPYPDISRDEYHAATSNNLYISSGGRLYIFDLVPFDYSYPYHSIRTISRDFVGTYSGIYYKGKKLESPEFRFTDSYIRQFGDRAFICNYSLHVFERDFLQTGILVPEVNSYQATILSGGFINDLFPSPDGTHYYVATQNELKKTDYQFMSDTTLFVHDKKDSPVTLITENPWTLNFISGNELYKLDYQNDKISLLVSLDEPMLAGLTHKNQTYLITSKALYRFNAGQKLEKLADLDKAHSLILLSGSELVISSDLGLYLFNIAGRSLSTIIRGVEFNRKALHKENDLIYAGSINGLYTIQSGDIPALIQANKAYEQEDHTMTNVVVVMGVASVLLLTMGAFVIRFQRKLKIAEQTIEILKDPAPQITRELIEEHIQNNLSKASLNMLQDDFKMSSSQLYIILKPDRPGAIIQRIRLDVFKTMRAEGKSYQEIADATGLSISYLKKLKS
jgi:AraC-like DNA-binding protein